MKLKPAHYIVLALFAVPLAIVALPLLPVLLFLAIITYGCHLAYDSQLERWEYQLTGKLPEPRKPWKWENFIFPLGQLPLFKNIHALSRSPRTPWLFLCAIAEIPGLYAGGLILAQFKDDDHRWVFFVLAVIVTLSIVVGGSYYAVVRWKLSEHVLDALWVVLVLIFFSVPKTGLSDALWVLVLLFIPSYVAVRSLKRLAIAARAIHAQTGEVPMGNVSRTFPRGKKHW
jgi:hypothetical protein